MRGRVIQVARSAALVVCFVFALATSATASTTIPATPNVEQLAVDGRYIHWTDGRRVYSHERLTGVTTTSFTATGRYFVSKIVAASNTLGVETADLRKSTTRLKIHRIDLGKRGPRRVSSSLLKHGRAYTCGNLVNLGDVSPDGMLVTISHKIRQRHRKCGHKSGRTTVSIVGKRASGRIGNYFYFSSFRGGRFPYFDREAGAIDSVDAELRDSAIGGHSLQYSRDSARSTDFVLDFEEFDSPLPVLTPDLSPRGRLIVNLRSSKTGKPYNSIIYLKKRDFDREAQYDEDYEPEGGFGLTLHPSYYASSGVMQFCGERVLSVAEKTSSNQKAVGLATFTYPFDGPPSSPNTSPGFYRLAVAELAIGTIGASSNQLLGAACDSTTAAWVVSDATTGQSSISYGALAEYPLPAFPRVD